MIDVFTISLLSIALALSITIVINLRRKANVLESELIKLKETSNESYIKFLSDSRDWAFEYIEEVQKVLEEFSSKIEPQLKYYNTYGKTVNSPHEIIIDRIDEAYQGLKNILPEDNKEK